MLLGIKDSLILLHSNILVARKKYIDSMKLTWKAYLLGKHISFGNNHIKMFMDM